MDLKSGFNIIDNLSESGVKELSFTTREPLLNPFICQYIERCSQNGIKTTLITNGICLADEKLSGNLIKSGLDSISVSLEGATADSNDKIRGEHSFERAMLGIRTFQHQLYKHLVAVPVNLQMSLNAYNSDMSGRLPKLINDLPFDSIAIGTLSNSGNARLNQDIFLSDNKYFTCFLEIAKEYMKIDSPNYILYFKSLMPWEAVLLKILTGYDLFPETPKCSVLDGIFSMLPDGSVIPCISLSSRTKNRVGGSDTALSTTIETAFSECIEEIKTDNDKIKKEFCAHCYFLDRCFLCPAFAEDKEMRDLVIRRCIEAQKRFEEYVESQYQKGCFLVLDKAQVIFSYRELIVQKSYAGNVRKEFRFQLESEDLFVVENLINGSLFRKQSFQVENKMIQSLVTEGIITLQGGENEQEYEA